MARQASSSISKLLKMRITLSRKTTMITGVIAGTVMRTQGRERARAGHPARFFHRCIHAAKRRRHEHDFGGNPVADQMDPR